MSVPHAFRLLVNPLRSSRRLYTTGTSPVRFASIDDKLSPSVAKAAASVVGRGALSPAALHADGPLRNDWSRDEIQAIYDSPFMDLLYFGVSARIGMFCVRAVYVGFRNEIMRWLDGRRLIWRKVERNIAAD